MKGTDEKKVDVAPDSLGGGFGDFTAGMSAATTDVADGSGNDAPDASAGAGSAATTDAKVTKLKKPSKGALADSLPFPRETLESHGISNKMIRDNNVSVMLIVAPGTPVERQVPLASIARAIKAKCMAG